MKTWINALSLKSELLLRGTETKNGFKAATFQELCCEKGPLLIIIKSHNNKVFGGYSSVYWPKE